MYIRKKKFINLYFISFISLISVNCFAIYHVVDIKGTYKISGLPVTVSSSLDGSNKYIVDISLKQTKNEVDQIVTTTDELTDMRWPGLIHSSSGAENSNDVSISLEATNKPGFIFSEQSVQVLLPVQTKKYTEKGAARIIDDGKTIRWSFDVTVPLENWLNKILSMEKKRRTKEKQKYIDECHLRALLRASEYWTPARLEAAIPVDSLINFVSAPSMPEPDSLHLSEGVPLQNIPLFENSDLYLLTGNHSELLEHLIWVHNNSTDTFNIDVLNHELAIANHNVHIDVE